MKKGLFISGLLVCITITLNAQWTGTNPLWTNSNVGIGIASPSSLLHLRINESILTGDQWRYPLTLELNDNDGGNLWQGSGVGIKFHLSAVNINADMAEIVARSRSTGGQGQLIFRTGTNGSLVTNAIIDEYGRIGIGTSSPISRLEVENSAGGAASATYSTTAANAGIAVSAVGVPLYNHLFMGVGSATYTWIQSQHGNSTAQDLVLNPVGGKVGIGWTSPDAPLCIGDRVKVGWTAPTYGIEISTSKATEGGWARDFGFMQYDNSAKLGGFGGYGGENTLTYYWIGKNYSDNIARFFPDGAANLLYDNALRLTTASSGVNISGSLGISGNINGSGTGVNLDINPDVALRLGRSSDNTGFAVDVFKGDNSTTINHHLRGNGNSYLSANNGNVGIGTTTPYSKLHVQGNQSSTALARFFNNDYSTNIGSGMAIFTGAATGDTYTVIQAFDAGATSTNNLILNSIDGGVGIGTTNPGSYKLNVWGRIRAHEVVVNTDGADFVFDPDYKLPSLSDIETFIKENKHLPDLASASEMRENGMNVSEMQTKLLQKLEEMTLYIIEQNKKNELQSREIDLLKQEVEALKNRK
jgi:hypothetical protein